MRTTKVVACYALVMVVTLLVPASAHRRHVFRREHARTRLTISAPVVFVANHPLQRDSINQRAETGPGIR
jgi:hypothetical protein